MLADLDLLKWLGVRVIEQEDQASIWWALLEGAPRKPHLRGPRVLVIERTYREGALVSIREPTDADLAAAKKSAWDIWNGVDAERDKRTDTGWRPPARAKKLQTMSRLQGCRASLDKDRSTKSCKKRM
jgi:hypothetical protein